MLITTKHNNRNILFVTPHVFPNSNPTEQHIKMTKWLLPLSLGM